MTPSRLDCHFFKGAYLIGLNHIIFCADEIGLNHIVLTQLDLQMANGIRLKRMKPSRLDCHFFKGAYLIELNYIIFLCRLDRT